MSVAEGMTVKSIEARALVEKVVARLRARGETLGFAESCTGGLLSSWITELAGVSDVFMGSVVAYSNQLKMDLLGVPEATLKAAGAVSPQTASALAAGTRRTLGVSWAVAITGIAGPTGGTPQKPVGTVCFAVAGAGLEGATGTGPGGGPAETVAEMCHFSGDRRTIQEASAFHALELLWQRLCGDASKT